jgi:hypothetical protein
MCTLFICGKLITGSSKASRLWRHRTSCLRGHEIPGHLDVMPSEHRARTGTRCHTNPFLSFLNTHWLSWWQQQRNIYNIDRLPVQRLSHWINVRALCSFNYAVCHEDMWGNGGIAPPFLTSTLDGGEWPVSRPWYPLHMRLGGPESWFGRYEEKKILSLPGIDSRPSIP